MRLRLPPISAYPHSIDYIAKAGEDDWGKPITAEPVKVARVRVDEAYDFKRLGTNTTNDMPNALIFMFKKYNPVMPAFENGSAIVYNDKTYTIVAVIPLYFMSDDIIGYELEVK